MQHSGGSTRWHQAETSQLSGQTVSTDSALEEFFYLFFFYSDAQKRSEDQQHVIPHITLEESRIKI